MHILLGTDGSSYALAAARFLSTLLHPEVRAHVDLITVVDPERTDGGNDRDRSRHRLDRTRSEIVHPGIAVESRVLEGDPARTLLSEAGSGAHDLVVVGVKGCGATPFFELGSVARRMTRATTPSLLLVRKGGGGYARQLPSEARSGFRALVSAGKEVVGEEMQWGILSALALGETLTHSERPGQPNGLRELDRLARRSEADLLILDGELGDGDTLRTTIWTAPCTVLVARPSVSGPRAFGAPRSRSTLRPSASHGTEPAHRDPRRRSKTEVQPS